MGVKRFVWDEVSDNVLLETDETDTVTARYCQRPETFGELLFQDRSGTKNFYHYDGNASTCNLTDSSESVTDTTLYTAFGEEVSSSGSTTNPFGYKGAVGYYTNDSTGDIYVRNRSYEPAKGRWLSQDALGFIDGTSLYKAYFVPKSTDPTGFFCQSECCCCVDAIDFKVTVLSTDDVGPATGHLITTTIKLKYVPSNQPNDCTFEWWEWSDHATEGSPARQWNNERENPDTRPSFRSWDDERNKPCPGEEPVIDKDPATLAIWEHRYIDRRLYFAVKVKSAEGCDCKHSELWWAGFQYLKIDDGVASPPVFLPNPPFGWGTPPGYPPNW